VNHLLEKTSLTIEPTLAKIVGLNESIFIKQLHYWLSKTKHKKDGKKWIFNTVMQWQEQLPFWSEKTISRIIQKLKTEEWIIVKQYDKNLLNRTNWYTLNYEKIEELKKEMNIETPQDKSNKKEEKPNKKSPNEGGDFYSETFKQFWERYPRKTGGVRLAMKEFSKLSETQQRQAIYGAEKYSSQTSNTEEEYIKTAKTWLRDGYYEDYEIKEDSNQNNIKIGLVDTLETKIIYLIEKNYPSDIEIWNQKEGDEFIFTKEEKEVLQKLGNGLLEYKEIEFRKGEIRAYFKGVIQ
jgi:hypothetical protein